MGFRFTRAERHRRYGLLLLVSCLVACRIYREEAPAAAGAAGAGGRGQPASAPTAGQEERTGAAASEAMNLWVLNRREGDLQALRANEQRPAAPRPKALALIVLGLGAPQPCAEQLARGALDALAGGADPARVTARLLEALRRGRWPNAGSAAFSSVLRSSLGHFGGLEAAPAELFSAGALLAAVSRNALLDGRSGRWRAAALEGAGSEVGGIGCSAPLQGELSAAAGALLRTESGEFWGGMVSRDEPADAGLLSTIAQYGVSLAVGAAGGVLLLGDCIAPPPQSLAEHVYASADWNAASGERAGDECSSTHVLLTRERAWVSRPIPVAWSAVEAPSLPVEPPAPAPAAAPDAGSGTRPAEAP